VARAQRGDRREPVAVHHLGRGGDGVAPRRRREERDVVEGEGVTQGATGSAGFTPVISAL
jgi:hypothetical protein